MQRLRKGTKCQERGKRAGKWGRCQVVRKSSKEFSRTSGRAELETLGHDEETSSEIKNELVSFQGQSFSFTKPHIKRGGKFPTSAVVFKALAQGFEFGATKKKMLS